MVVVVVIKHQEATEKKYLGHCMPESTSVKAQNVYIGKQQYMCHKL
jgi:hypothetical protein